MQTRRVWLEVNLSRLRENYRRIAAATDPCRVLAVLKANAYGLGVEPVARALADAGVHGFGVAEPHEAEQLLALGKPVQILSAILPDEIPGMVRAGVILPVTDLATAQLINDAAQRQNRIAEAHIKIDTGMGRLGIQEHEAAETIRAISRLPHLHCTGIFTHFPLAYDSADPYTANQINRFLALLQTLRGNAITFATIHAANSDAINNIPAAIRPPFNLVRTGLNLHGSFDTTGRRALPLQQVLTLKTRLAAIRTLPADRAVGYGLTYRTSAPMRVGTISAGYADGLPLALSNHGFVQIHGLPCPVIGRISMDYTTVNLDAVPHAQVGDEVICLADGGNDVPGIDDWAALKNTHPYEIICSLGTRVQRVYLM